MLPIEKAKILIEKFVNQSINFLYNDSEDGRCIGAGYMTYKSAKDCAIQLIDSIIDENHFLDNFQVEFTEKLVKRLDYWNAVKDAVKSL